MNCISFPPAIHIQSPALQKYVEKVVKVYKVAPKYACCPFNNLFFFSFLSQD